MNDVSAVTLTGGRFDWQDPFLIEQQLSEGEKLTRDTARQLDIITIIRSI
jgi:hypothetical protein